MDFIAVAMPCMFATDYDFDFILILLLFSF